MSNPRPLLGWNHSLNINLEDVQKLEYDTRWITSATSFFIKNIGEVSVYIEQFFDDRWVVRVQESYLNKKEGSDQFNFDHKNDIPNFQFARFSTLVFPFTFGSKEEALVAFVEYENRHKHVHPMKRDEV